MRLHRIHLLAALVAGAALVGSSATAATVTARLKAPLSTPMKSIAGGTVFECLKDVCAARAASSGAGDLRGCRELVRQVGAVTSFGSDSKPLPADELAACNQAAGK